MRRLAASVLSQQRRFLASGAQPAPRQPLLAACVIERIPSVLPQPEDWELSYWAWREEKRRQFYKVLPKALAEPKSSDDDASLETWEPAVVPETHDPDLRKVSRAAREYLYLVVKHANGDWGFPHTESREGETMRQAAERAAKELPGSTLQLHFIGNAPFAHMKLPANAPSFLFRASYLEGQFKPSKGYTDYVWVTKAEIQAGKYFSSEQNALLALAL